MPPRCHHSMTLYRFSFYLVAPRRLVTFSSPCGRKSWPNVSGREIDDYGAADSDFEIELKKNKKIRLLKRLLKNKFMYSTVNLGQLDCGHATNCQQWRRSF